MTLTAARAALAPRGVLRAAINLSNFLLDRHRRQQMCYSTVYAILATILATRDQSARGQSDQTSPRMLPPKPRFHQITTTPLYRNST